MKAGDLLVSSANTLPSWGIRIGTVSCVSHVALATSSSSVIESAPTGTRPKSLSDFLKDNRRVYLLKRPTELSPHQESLLQKSVAGIQRDGYNLPRSLTSGFVRFGFWFWLVCFLLVNSKLIFDYNAPWLILAGYNFLMGLLFLVIYTCAWPERFNRAVDKLHLPGFMKTDLEKHFCSQLVMELDQSIGGGLSKGVIKIHELRPKDIKRRAIKKLGYECRRIKPPII
ncbi:hypothetical protein [Pseudomonas sp. DWRC2-2]|uniref:hypothetical protein n=1 Tax=Pseudomonas sp. DWRC2-2 TaxID=2804567 RepID=UPI003CFA1B9C